MERPTGVTVLAILNVIGAVLMFLMAAFFQYLSSIIPVEMSEMPLMSVIFQVIGVGFVIGGVIGLVIAYGFWTGKSWAWWLAIIFSALSLLSNLAALPAGIIGAVIAGIIIYYLTRPHVREYFGT